MLENRIMVQNGFNKAEKWSEKNRCNAERL